MKKSIFLFFAALLFSASAWAGWCGDSFITVNGLWCTGSNSYVHDGGKFHGKDLGTLTTLELGGEFQVWPSSNTAGTLCYKIDNGTENSISLPKEKIEGSNSKHSGSGAVDLSGLAEGSHSIAVWFKHGTDIDNNGGSNYVATFTIAAATPDPEPEPAETETVYFVNNGAWAGVSIYGWGGSVTGTGINKWSGVPMTKTGETLTVDGKNYDIYSYSAEVGAVKNILFNYNGDANKTSDFVWTNGNYYYFGAAKDFVGTTKEGVVTALTTPLPDETIYFVNNKKWTTINVYAWGGSKSDLNASWPGKPVMTKTAEKIGEYEVYSLTATQGSYNNLIFNDGSAQTADYVWSNGKYYWVGKDKDFDGDTKENAQGELTAPVENVYTIAGAAALVGKEWDINATENVMQAGSVDGEYTLIKTDMTIAKGTYEYKVVCNRDWNDAGQFPAQGNQSVKIEEDGIYTLTFTYIVGTELKVELQKTSGADIETKYYVAGTLPGVEWNPTSFEMTANGSIYSAKFENVPAETYSFRITSGGWSPSWGYTHMDGSYSEISAGESDNNFSLKLTKTTTFTILFDSENEKITFEGLTEKDPVEDYYTIVGVTAITGVHWDPANEDNKMTKDGEVYTLTKTGLQLEAGDYEYKVAKNGAWGNGDYPNDGSNQKVNIAENGVYTIVYTYTVGTSLTAVPTKTGDYTPDKPVYTVAGDAALCGTNWKADDANNDMTDNIDGTFTWTKTGVKLTGDAGFKVVKNHDFGVAYPAENWVIKIADYDGAAIYTVTITFTESSKDIVVTLTKTDDVTPSVITYVLMGVNGDWDNGIALTQNPGNADEYVLENQVIIKATDAVKVVTLTDGTATAWCGDVDTWSNATYTADGDGNIVLEDGIYTFYFKKNDNLIYINQTGYARNVTNKYGTICLPYASASTSGATFFEVVGQEAGKVYLASVTELEAGVPYIFEKSANQIKVVYTGNKETTAGSANGLVGTFADNTEVPNTAYILYNNAFCTNNDATNPNKINAYRAYLDLSAVIGGAPQQMPGRRYISMDVQGENEATGLDQIVVPEGQAIKAIVNGQLIIIRDGVKYNVQGQVIR